VALKKEFSSKIEFDWEILDVVVGGKSAIDTKRRLPVRSQEEAVKFIECYGYELENPIEKAELFGNFQESLNFIKKFFIAPENPDGLKLEIPRKLLELTDPVLLLSNATYLNVPDASSSQKYLSLWSCALLKVMHTISHLDKDLRTSYFSDIQKQILDRFYKHIHRDEVGVYLGKDEKDLRRINLVAFETKPKKSRESMILKLLHKPENVAEELFDRVGVRFVTKNKIDAIRVIKYLKDRSVIMPANIKPSRSRNSLISLKSLSTLIDEFRNTEEEFSSEEDFWFKLNSQIEKIESLKNSSDRDNPHSSEEYKSVQFTGRQLVKIKNSLYDDIRQIKNLIKEKGNISEDLSKAVEKIDLKTVQREVRFFYPFEVQLVDEKNHSENLEGQSSHQNYKKSQVQAAMKRVMGELVNFVSTT
jgi:uncharacterized protein (TIGR04562 family)